MSVKIAFFLSSSPFSYANFLDEIFLHLRAVLIRGAGAPALSPATILNNRNGTVFASTDAA